MSTELPPEVEFMKNLNQNQGLFQQLKYNPVQKAAFAVSGRSNSLDRSLPFTIEHLQNTGSIILRLVISDSNNMLTSSLSVLWHAAHGQDTCPFCGSFHFKERAEMKWHFCCVFLDQ